MTRTTSAAMLQEAQVQPGMRVLDLASGSGEPALTLASAVAPDGLVVATDLDIDQLAVAGAGARQHGLGKVALAQADAEILPFADRAFDLVTCRFAVWSFGDPERALAEARRVLREGGRATFAVFGPWEHCAWFITTIGVLRKHIQLPPGVPGSPSRAASPGTLLPMLQRGRFAQARELSRTVVWTWPGPAEELHRAVQEFPIFRPLFERIGSARRDQASREVLTAIRQYEHGLQVDLPMAVVLASGLRSDRLGKA